MVHVERLDRGTVHKLREIERTPAAEAWVGEVEDFILGWGPAEVFRSGQGQVLLVSDGGAVLGAAVHRPHDTFAAENVAGLLVEHRQRGKHRGEDVLRAVLDEAHRASGRPNVIFQVHKDNAAMQHLARKVAGDPEFTNGNYMVFIQVASSGRR